MVTDTVPPVMATLFAFCVDIVPSPVIAVFGMLLNVLLAPLIVLLVSVCVPVKVATVESIAIVTGVDPL